MDHIDKIARLITEDPDLWEQGALLPKGRAYQSFKTAETKLLPIEISRDERHASIYPKGNYLYHCAGHKDVPKILKTGIRPMGEFHTASDGILSRGFYFTSIDPRGSGDARLNSKDVAIAIAKTAKKAIKYTFWFLVDISEFKEYLEEDSSSETRTSWYLPTYQQASNLKFRIADMGIIYPGWPGSKDTGIPDNTKNAVFKYEKKIDSNWRPLLDTNVIISGNQKDRGTGPLLPESHVTEGREIHNKIIEFRDKSVINADIVGGVVIRTFNDLNNVEVLTAVENDKIIFPRQMITSSPSAVNAIEAVRLEAQLDSEKIASYPDPILQSSENVWRAPHKNCRCGCLDAQIEVIAKQMGLNGAFGRMVVEQLDEYVFNWNNKIHYYLLSAKDPSRSPQPNKKHGISNTSWDVISEIGQKVTGKKVGVFKKLTFDPITKATVSALQSVLVKAPNQRTKGEAELFNQFSKSSIETALSKKSIGQSVNCPVSGCPDAFDLALSNTQFNKRAKKHFNSKHMDLRGQFGFVKHIPQQVTDQFIDAAGETKTTKTYEILCTPKQCVCGRNDKYQEEFAKLRQAQKDMKWESAYNSKGSEPSSDMKRKRIWKYNPENGTIISGGGFTWPEAYSMKIAHEKRQIESFSQRLKSLLCEHIVLEINFKEPSGTDGIDPYDLKQPLPELPDHDWEVVIEMLGAGEISPSDAFHLGLSKREIESVIQRPVTDEELRG